jgi:hypothetical protein
MGRAVHGMAQNLIFRHLQKSRDVHDFQRLHLAVSLQHSRHS